MNTLVDTATLYISITTEIIQGLLSASVDYVLDTFGLSPDMIFELPTRISKPSDQLGLSFTEIYKQSNDLLSFDQFQLLLVKIFFGMLLSIFIFIYAAWHVYGSQIADQFMYSEMAVKTEHNDSKNSY